MINWRFKSTILPIHQYNDIRGEDPWNSCDCLSYISLPCPQCWCYWNCFDSLGWLSSSITALSPMLITLQTSIAVSPLIAVTFERDAWNLDLRNWTKMNKNNIVSKPEHHRDDILKGGLWIGCNHWCGYCPKQQMEWSRAIFKRRNIFFLQNSSGANKRKIILQKIFGEKNIILKYIVEAQRRKTSIFRKDLAIL